MLVCPVCRHWRQDTPAGIAQPGHPEQWPDCPNCGAPGYGRTVVNRDNERVPIPPTYAEIEASTPVPYVRQGDEFEPGTRVHLTGDRVTFREVSETISVQEQVGEEPSGETEDVTDSDGQPVLETIGIEPILGADGQPLLHPETGLPFGTPIQRPRQQPVYRPVYETKEQTITRRERVDGDHPSDACLDGTVVGHDPAEWPAKVRRHRVLMDDGRTITTDFAALAAGERGTA